VRTSSFSASWTAACRASASPAALLRPWLSWSALDWLERAAASGDQFLMAMSLTPTWFDAVRASPRFAAVARTLGLDSALMAQVTER
jgi:hypothetical protein